MDAIKKVNVVANAREVKKAFEKAQKPKTEGNVSFVLDGGTKRYSVTVSDASEHTEPNVWRFTGKLVRFIEGRRKKAKEVPVTGKYSYATEKGVLHVALS